MFLSLDLFCPLGLWPRCARRLCHAQAQRRLLIHALFLEPFRELIQEVVVKVLAQTVG